MGLVGFATSQCGLEGWDQVEAKATHPHDALGSRVFAVAAFSYTEERIQQENHGTPVKTSSLQLGSS